MRRRRLWRGAGLSEAARPGVHARRDPGWGELTFTKIVWPDVPVLGYFEYYFLAKGGSVGFDPEFPANPATPYIMHARNAVNYINLETVDLGQTPTLWQRGTYPTSFHDKLYTCHDGIRTDQLRPDPSASITLDRLGRAVTREDEIFTYMARNMEPTRGFHVFMRALPDILAARPNARALIIGMPPLNWSDVMFRKRRTENGAQETQA